MSPEFHIDSPGCYYMKFTYKADYQGHFDKQGIPMLDYHGTIGLQYNPIAIAQYGLGNYNIYFETDDENRFKKFIAVSDWLVENLNPNSYNVPVWQHHFDFEYRDTLLAPWYSGLAQGLGMSVLLRAYHETKDKKYLSAHQSAWVSMTKDVTEGGVIFTDSNNEKWLEEYIVFPPTHILNGFIWGMWGIYDTWVYLQDNEAKQLFDQLTNTLVEHLEDYDTGYWSLYEQSGTWLPMLASPFYHDLHLVQLKVMHRLTNHETFKGYHDRWSNYKSNWFNRKRALIMKAIFKIIHY